VGSVASGDFQGARIHLERSLDHAQDLAFGNHLDFIIEGIIAPIVRASGLTSSESVDVFLYFYREGFEEVTKLVETAEDILKEADGAVQTLLSLKEAIVGDDLPGTLYEFENITFNLIARSWSIVGPLRDAAIETIEGILPDFTEDFLPEEQRELLHFVAYESPLYVSKAIIMLDMKPLLDDFHK